VIKSTLFQFADIRKIAHRYNSFIEVRNFYSHDLTRLILAILLGLNIQSVIAQSTTVQLTEVEKAYLQQLGSVAICVDPDWKPFEYIDENNEFAGIAADLIQLISQRTGIEFKLLTTKDWDESLMRSRSGDCMILPFLNQTTDRDAWLLFTAPYYTDYNVFITREEHEYIPDPSVLKGKIIALPRGTSVEERIKRDYPNLNILLFDNEAQAIDAVNKREADMTLRSLTMAAFIIKSEGWFNLKIAGQLPDYTNRFSIGVSKEHPMLRDILDKAIETITEKDVQQAVNKHVSITIVTDKDYTFIIRIIIFLAIIVLLGLIWNYQLRKLNSKLGSNEKELIQLSEQLKNDIAARKKVEAELKDSERQLSSLISNLPGFVYQCLNDENYTMKFISTGCMKITGYKPIDYSSGNVKFSEVILYEDLHEKKRKWEIALAEKAHFEHEYRIRRSDGEIRWVWERGYGVFKADGKLSVLEGFIDDVTARRQAEEQLAHQNRFYKLISEISSGFMNANPENIDAKINQMLRQSGLFLDVDRTFLFQLSEDEQLLSYTNEWCAEGVIAIKNELQNYPVVDVPLIAEIVKKRQPFFVSDVDALPEGIDKEELIKQEVQSALRLPIITGDRFLGYYGFDSVKSKLAIDEIQIGLLQVLANILGDALIRNLIELEKKIAEEGLKESELELRELNAQKDKFFSIIAHDLKSPFNGVLALSEMLVEQINEKDYSGIEHYANLMWQSSERAMNLLMNLLEWAQSQTGRIGFNPEFFEVYDLIEENALVFDEVAAQKDISIKRSLGGTISILADKQMISTVLRNLISNAVKFTYKGGEIYISAQKTESEVVISVSDNGKGMPKARLEKIFRIDQNESTPGTANENGTGLGLILCKEFVEKHEGRIWVESIEGKGSSFSFAIPIV
jgi:PAS domain S-box-containing protein